MFPPHWANLHWEKILPPYVKYVGRNSFVGKNQKSGKNFDIGKMFAGKLCSENPRL